MRNIIKFAFLSLMTINMSACSLIPLPKSYSGYEEYFEKELKYTKYTDVNALNAAISESSYFWSKDEATKYTAYYTAKSDLVMVYKDEPKVLVSYIDGTSIDFRVKNNDVLIETDKDVSYNATTEEIDVGDGELDDLKVAKDSGGYLVVTYGRHMLYVTSDLKNFYVNENNTNVFQGYESTKTIPSSTLLTETLAALGADQRLCLPAPSNQYEIWYGLDYYKEKPSHGTAYIAGVHPKDYVEVLKNNGFTVIRSFEDPFYAFYGEYGGYWYCYDAKEEIKMLVSLQFYLYTNSSGKNYGPYENTNIWFYRTREGYFGENQITENEDWTSAEKEIMAGWYDGTIDASKVPFIKLGQKYSVPNATTMSSAHEGLLDGTLKYGSKCYNITDNSRVYRLDGYDEVLEANGFHKFDPQCDLSVYEQKYAFSKTENSKYINCFINDELDIAIKYYFDVNFGNTIRVFKKSAMESWNNDDK